ncbi:MAG: shikimate kinase [Bradymonadia bacterium]
MDDTATYEVEALKAMVGRRLRGRRQALDLTLKGLAEASGLSERYIGLAERGQANVSLAKLYAMCRALGLTIAEVVAEEPRGAVLALMGVRGAGKSSVGRTLADQMGYRFVELDARIEALAELSLSEIFAVHGEAYYRRLEDEALSQLLGEREDTVLATGGSLVTHEIIWGQLKRSAQTVWLKARPEDHWDRVIQQGDRRPMRDHPQAMAELKALLAARAPLYQEAHFTVDTASRTVEQVVQEIIRIVAPQARR